MKILFLDDDKGRHALFKSMIGFSADFVFTAEKCIEALGLIKYDVISLDHDLTGEIYVDQSRKDCGMEVVRWLEQHQHIKQGKIICHSYNTKARVEMQKRLSILPNIREVKQIPFALDDYEKEFQTPITKGG